MVGLNVFIAQTMAKTSLLTVVLSLRDYLTGVKRLQLVNLDQFSVKEDYLYQLLLRISFQSLVILKY